MIDVVCVHVDIIDHDDDMYCYHFSMIWYGVRHILYSVEPF